MGLTFSLLLGACRFCGGLEAPGYTVELLCCYLARFLNKTSKPLFSGPSCYSHVNSVYILCSSAAGGSLAQAKKVDLDAVPQIKGQTIYEYDLETALEKPWRMPGMVCHSGWVRGRGWWGWVNGCVVRHSGGKRGTRRGWWGVGEWLCGPSQWVNKEG